MACPEISRSGCEKNRSTSARIADGDRVTIVRAGGEVTRRFKLDTTLKGTIALEPTFDSGFAAANAAYRFEKVKIMKASNDE